MAAAVMEHKFDIPKKYKGVVYDKPGTISTKVVELDTPEPGVGDVLVRLWVENHDQFRTLPDSRPKPEHIVECVIQTWA